VDLAALLGAKGCGTKDIATGIKRGAGERPAAIIPASEVVQVGIGPLSARGRQLEDVAVLVRAVELRGAVKVAGTVECQVSHRASHSHAGQVGNYGECPSAAGGRHFKDRTSAASATGARGAVKISCGIHHQAAHWSAAIINAINAIVEVVKLAERPSRS